jgi:hypothetical protein
LSDKKTTNTWDSKKGLKAMFHYWHPLLCSCQLPVNIHTWGHVVREKKDGPTINLKRPHQYSFMTHSQLMKIIKRIYNWRSTLYKKMKPLVQYPPVSFDIQPENHRQATLILEHPFNWESICRCSWNTWNIHNIEI